MTRQSVTTDVALGGLKFDRPMETGMVWAPPATALDDGYLLFAPGSRKKSQIITKPLLLSFIDLAEKDDTAILDFAARWGVLGVDETGWPDPKAGITTREPIAGWKVLAGRFRAAVRIAAEFHQDRPGHARDWLALTAGENRYNDAFGPWRFKSPLTDELQGMLRAMISRFGVSPRFWWNEQRGQWQIDLDAGGLSNLPGLLVIQLMLLIADKDGFALCSGCHNSYFPTRKPDPTRRNYCDACGIQASWRDSARERRKKQRAEKETRTRKGRKQ